MFQLLFIGIFAAVFLFAGIKGLKNKQISYNKKNSFGKNEKVIVTGTPALALSWLYILLGLFFLMGPLSRIFSSQRVVY